jgi:hypothetical protein
VTRIYRYVLMTDTGMAPHVKRGTISLATCKPQLRGAAQAGDWVVGSFPSPHNDRIAWAGVIEHVLPVGLYGHAFKRRDDALYPEKDGIPTRRRDKLLEYHPDPEQQRKDRHGNALLFVRERSWYFGADGRFLPSELAHLAARGQGHRVNGMREGDVERLEAWLREQAPPGIHGAPRHGRYRAQAGSCAKSCSTPPNPRPARQPRSRPC